MTVVEDQVNLWPEGSLNHHVLNVTPEFFEWQQEIVAGVSGQLVGIDLYPGGPEDVFIEFRTYMLVPEPTTSTLAALCMVWKRHR